MEKKSLGHLKLELTLKIPLQVATDDEFEVMPLRLFWISRGPLSALVLIFPLASMLAKLPVLHINCGQNPIFHLFFWQGEAKSETYLCQLWHFLSSIYLLTRASKQTRPGLAGGFQLQQCYHSNRLCHKTWKGEQFRRVNSPCEETATGFGREWGLAQGALPSGRTGLDRNHISLHKEILWIKRKYISALTSI